VEIKDQAIAGSSGVSLTAVAYLAYELLLGTQGDIIDIQAKVTELETQHADRCEVDAAFFRGRAADKRDEAATSRSVADRYRALRDYLAQQDPPESLSPVDVNRLAEKDDEADDFDAEARAFDESARVVCQIPNP